MTAKTIRDICPTIAKMNMRTTGIGYWVSKYIDKPCVAASITKPHYTIFIIVTAKKLVKAFFIVPKTVWFGGYNYRVGRFDDKLAFSILNGKDATIHDAHLIRYIGSYLTVNAL